MIFFDLCFSQGNATIYRLNSHVRIKKNKEKNVIVVYII